MITEKEAAIARRLAKLPQPSAKELTEAEETVEKLDSPVTVARVVYIDLRVSLAMTCSFWLQYVWLPSLLTALVFGRGLIVRAFDCVFVDR